MSRRAPSHGRRNAHRRQIESIEELFEALRSFFEVLGIGIANALIRRVANGIRLIVEILNDGETQIGQFRFHRIGDDDGDDFVMMRQQLQGIVESFVQKIAHDED